MMNLFLKGKSSMKVVNYSSTVYFYKKLKSIIQVSFKI